MAKRINWEKDSRRLTPEDVNESRNERTFIFKAGSSAYNALNLAWLARILAHPRLVDYERVKAEASIVWLKENNTRTLSRGWTQFFVRVERSCTTRERGEVSTFSAEELAAFKAGHKRRMVLRAARYEETRLKKPDWMQDPSRLPKKPPGVK